jgi:hypothetical protein
MEGVLGGNDVHRLMDSVLPNRLQTLVLEHGL